MSFLLLVNILMSEEDCHALQKEPFRYSCAKCTSGDLSLQYGNFKIFKITTIFIRLKRAVDKNLVSNRKFKWLKNN